MMSSFSLGTQRVNGYWDYAMACQTPFSSPALLSPLLPFKRAEAKLGIPARFDQMHLNAVAALHMLWHRRGNKTGILLHCEGELPLTRASHLPCSGKDVIWIYNCRTG